MLLRGEGRTRASGAVQGDGPTQRTGSKMREEIFEQLVELNQALENGLRDIGIVGRGLNYANALELGLKLMETCYVLAERFSAADLLHGPRTLNKITRTM